MPNDFTIGDFSGAPDWDAINLKSNVRQLTQQVDDLQRLLSGYRDGLISAFDEGYNPTQYQMLLKRSGAWPGITGGTTGSYPWHLYNTTTGSTGQVQLNGGDDQVAQLNGFVCNVNGNPSDTQTGMPPAYPQLAVAGNGYIYAKAVPTTAGTASPLTSLDLTFQTSVQAQDTSNPAAYYWMLVATISNYAVDGSGNVSFTVNNATGSGYGYSILYYCNGVIGVY